MGDTTTATVISRESMRPRCGSDPDIRQSDVRMSRGPTAVSKAKSRLSRKLSSSNGFLDSTNSVTSNNITTCESSSLSKGSTVMSEAWGDDGRLAVANITRATSLDNVSSASATTPPRTTSTGAPLSPSLLSRNRGVANHNKGSDHDRSEPKVGSASSKVNVSLMSRKHSAKLYNSSKKQLPARGSGTQHTSTPSSPTTSKQSSMRRTYSSSQTAHQSLRRNTSTSTTSMSTTTNGTVRPSPVGLNSPPETIRSFRRADSSSKSKTFVKANATLPPIAKKTLHS